MSVSPQTSPAQSVGNVLSQLHTALLRKHALDAEAKALEEQIVAMRNIVSGIELGKALQQQVAAEATSRSAEPLAPGELPVIPPQ